MRYIPATPEDVATMLQAIGVDHISQLFETIPKNLRLERPLDIPPALSELDLVRQCQRLAGANVGATSMTSFLGGGAYAHYIPAVVDMVISRSEFATAYTPYQPEVAQGTLQAVFQMQTFVCELLGMEVANASNYEGASSLAEAALMARRMRRRYKGPNKVVVSQGVHPEYRRVLKTYLKNSDIAIEEVPIDASGQTDWAQMSKAATGGAVGVIVQSPNYFGVIEDLAEQRRLCDETDSAMIVNVTEALSLGLIKPPGAFGADIATGEAQALGVPLSFGGPYMGMFAAKQQYVRSMPGRLAGQTTDADGKVGYCLTLSTREQHIRREKATSNICTNAGLMALAFTVFTALMGKQGLPELARLNFQKSTYLKQQLGGVDGLELPFSGATFNEFVVRPTRKPAAAVLDGLAQRGILGGLPTAALAEETGRSELAEGILVNVTELHDRQTLDDAIQAFKEVSR